jgi:outer membrane protein OmpA-like peptidoglycan-associated protein
MGEKPTPLEERIYFASGETAITEPEQRETLEALTELLQESPDLRLRLIGHTDQIGSPLVNQEIAQQRAEATRDFLVEQGIAADRLQINGSINPPPDLDETAAAELSRCVRWQSLP